MVQKDRIKWYHIVFFIPMMALGLIFMVVRVVLLLIYFLLIMITLIPTFCSDIKKPCMQRYVRFLVKLWTSIILLTLNVWVFWSKRPKSKDCPKIIVSNHISSLDILTHLYLIDCTFLAKAEVRDNFFIGMICRLLDVIYVDRAHKKTDFE